jgi:hypothetical protein
VRFPTKGQDRVVPEGAEGVIEKVSSCNLFLNSYTILRIRKSSMQTCLCVYDFVDVAPKFAGISHLHQVFSSHVSVCKDWQVFNL